MTTALLKQYSNIIKSIGICNSLKTKHPLIYEDFCELFKKHPEYPKKVENMVDICIRLNKLNKNAFELNIIKDDGTIDNISYRCCIQPRTKDYNLKQAMRYAIIEQILDFKNNNELKCDFCNSTDNIEIDHIITFQDLYNQFIINKTNIPKTFDDNTFNSAMFKKDDEAFSKEWQDYHYKNAKLRCLCKKCNIGRNKKMIVKCI